VKAKTAEALADELGVDPTLLYRLLRAESAIGLLAEDDARGFALTEMGALLRSDHPQSLKAVARLAEGQQHYAIWKHLPAMVRDGKQNGFLREFDRGGFEHTRHDADYAERFNHARIIPWLSRRWFWKHSATLTSPLFGPSATSPAATSNYSTSSAQGYLMCALFQARNAARERKCVDRELRDRR